MLNWLNLDDQDNQDLEVRYIGKLILKDGFKVRYLNVETYTDHMRDRLTSHYASHGYNIHVKYNNTFAYCEVTAIKREKKYIEIAILLCCLWALYRVYTYY